MNDNTQGLGTELKLVFHLHIKHIMKPVIYNNLFLNNGVVQFITPNDK